MPELEFEEKKVVTPMARLSYPHLFTAKAYEEGADAKFSCTFLIPKNANMKAMMAVAAKVRDNAFGTDKSKWPKKGLKMPFLDGDKMDDPNAEGCWVVRASAKKAPGVLGPDREPVVDKESIYPGCFVHGSLVAFEYATKGNSGVGFALLGVMKVKDGERIGGSKNVAKDFEGVEVEDDGSDDQDNYEESDAADLGLDD